MIGHLDIFGACFDLMYWHVWTLIGVLVALAAYWMEWGKVECRKCHGFGGKNVHGLWQECPGCKFPEGHEANQITGSGRARRGLISRMWRKK